VCSIDDIIIYRIYEKEHEEPIHKVLGLLQEFSIYCKAEQYQFGVSDVGFLGFVINSEVIGTESDQMATIEDWQTPQSIRDVQVLLGFGHFYWRSVKQYA